VEQSITAAPSRFEALVTLYVGAEEIAGRVPAHWGAVEPIDAHSCLFRTGDDDLTWLALRIAMLGVDFEVREPPELVEQLRALAERLGRAVRPWTARSGVRDSG
jgi:predicted DNA-binding transcriptional regulator YafY